MSNLRRIYTGLTLACAIAAGLFLVLVTIGIGTEAIIRSLNLGMIRGLVDFAEHSMFNIAILAAPWILVNNGHISVNVVTDALPAAGAKFAAIFVEVAGLVLSALIAYYSTIIFVEGYVSEEMIFHELVIPEWWLGWQMPLAFALMTIEFAIRLRKVFTIDFAAGEHKVGGGHA